MPISPPGRVTIRPIITSVIPSFSNNVGTYMPLRPLIVCAIALELVRTFRNSSAVLMFGCVSPVRIPIPTFDTANGVLLRGSRCPSVTSSPTACSPKTTISAVSPDLIRDSITFAESKRISALIPVRASRHGKSASSTDRVLFDVTIWRIFFKTMVSSLRHLRHQMKLKIESLHRCNRSPKEHQWCFARGLAQGLVGSAHFLTNMKG